MITVLLGTGMRIGECLGLRWEDVNFKDRYISVNHNLTDRPVGAERICERHIQTTMDIYAEATQEKKQEVVAKLTGKIVIK